MTQCLGRDHAHQNIRVNFEIRGLDPDKAVGELNASVQIGHG